MQYLREKSHVLDDFRRLVADDEQNEDGRRFWRLVTVPYLERLQIGPAEPLLAEVRDLLQQVKSQFADIREPAYVFEPESQVRWRRDGSAEPTYAELAEGMLFAMEHLNVGCQAPEIKGRDADGGEFKLSDYRGKVVLLSFSANWCGSCVRMYPLERKLVKTMRERPFVMLSINGDPEIATLRQAIERGEITWRCWWDGGRGGPISTRWHVEGWPTVYVIDAQGIIRHKSHSDRHLEETIEDLVRKADSSHTSRGQP